jgi:hypothetical protein
LATLTELGFNAVDADAKADADDHLEDLRVTDPDAPGCGLPSSRWRATLSVRLALHVARAFLDVDDCAPSGPEDARVASS